MRNLKFIWTLCLALTVSFAAYAQKPHVHILATGGTIAGAGSSATGSQYTAGQVAIGTLLDAVPEINDVAEVTGEQIVNIGSQDMSDEVWLTLAKRINEIFANNEADAVVITHGTDTMEETAFFLSLTIKEPKPVILVGAMRSSTAMSADGPLNLYNAVVAAADQASQNRGVMVCMNNKLLSAPTVCKMNTTDVETFQAPGYGPVGYVFGGKVTYSMVAGMPRGSRIVFDVNELTSLPKVGIVYSYSNIEADMVEPMLENGYKGIIHAGVGNGNIHKNVFPVLEQARENGIIVVRSTRVPTGSTTLDAEVDDNAYRFVASQSLNPQKARVLLSLSLTTTDDWQIIQKYFNFF
ncbi:MAG: L-asparaginase 2 [Porphyromonas sp.]|nr:L-asparaginase 2 [Porphyromonas sp.]